MVGFSLPLFIHQDQHLPINLGILKNGLQLLCGKTVLLLEFSEKLVKLILLQVNWLPMLNQIGGQGFPGQTRVRAKKKTARKKTENNSSMHP